MSICGFPKCSCFNGLECPYAEITLTCECGSKDVKRIGPEWVGSEFKCNRCKSQWVQAI